jgi:FAD/FMN-containing dehydrogenase
VTKVVLKARPLPDRILPLSYSFPGLDEAGPFIGGLVGAGVSPEHLMFADGANFRWLRSAGIETGVQDALVTVVLAGDPAAVRDGETKLDDLAGRSGGSRAPDGVAGREWDQRSNEFRMRRAGTGSLPGEVLVPLARWSGAIRETYQAIRRHRLNAAVIGTLADRGEFMLMPYYLLDERRQARSMAAMTFNYRLAELALRHGGRPVGQGMYFAFLLDRIHDDGRVRQLRELKRLLDPNGVLNPGKMLEARTRFGTSVPASYSVLSMKLFGMLRSRMAPEPMPGKPLPRQDTEAPGRD